MSKQIWTAQQAADYLEISKTAIEVAKSKKGKPTWLWELVDMLIPDAEKNLFYRDDVIRFANKIERQEHTRYLVLNILDEIVSKGLMTVDELAIFLDINEASIRKYLVCSDKPKYKRAIEILFKIFDEIHKPENHIPQKHIPIPSAPYQSNYDNSDSYFDGYFSPKTS